MPSLRYVVLLHEGAGESHFDLMFETHPGSDLVSWRAEAWPLSSGEYLCRVPDHGPHWLTREGPVSGGRGTATRVAEGTCQQAHLSGGLMEVTFADGSELTLIRDSPEQWLCWIV